MSCPGKLTRYMVLACTLFLVFGSLASAAGGLLDGKRFIGETGEEGKDKGEKEEFVFKDGNFDPLGCHQYGFAAAPYAAGAEGKTIHFTAETKSPKEGVMKWSGSVTGTQLEGKAVWLKDSRELRYWFRGTLQGGGDTPASREDADPSPPAR